MSIAPIFETETVGNVIVVTPLRDVNMFEKGDLDRSIDRVVEQLPQGDSAHLVLDFCKMPFFGTMMLTAMLRFWKRIRDAGGNMALCNLTPDSLDVLQVTRLDTVWNVYLNQAEAIAKVPQRS